MRLRDEGDYLRDGDASGVGVNQAALFQRALGEAKRAVFGREEARWIPDETLYSAWIKSRMRLVVAGLMQDDPEFASSVEAVYLMGLVAYGAAPAFRDELEGEKLGIETRRLFSLLSAWMFSQILRGDDVGARRFLSGQYLTPLEVLLVSPEGVGVNPYVMKTLQEACAEAFGFCPAWTLQSAHSGALDPAILLKSWCVSGYSTADVVLEALSSSELARIFDHASRDIARGLRECKPAGLAQVRSALVLGDSHLPLARAAGLQNIDESGDRSAAVQLGVGEEQWVAGNEHFFARYQAGEYDQILVEDATTDLEDYKGWKKDCRFTIVRVLGLEEEGAIIPCRQLVIKLRGLPHYRSDVNNQFDLLKEYAAYRYLHARMGTEDLPFPCVGPPLFSAARLNIPFEPGVKQNIIGFFMQAIEPAKGQRIYTCRVRQLTDPWRYRRLLESILHDAAEAGVQLNTLQLHQRLAQLITDLWKQDLSIDFCDMAIFYLADGAVERLLLIDFERLNFSELVQEQHILLDTIFDLKTRLPKRFWMAVLPNLFRAEDDGGEYLSLEALHAKLKRKGRKRILGLSLIRSMRRLFMRILGQQRGAELIARWIRRMLRWGPAIEGSMHAGDGQVR